MNRSAYVSGVRYGCQQCGAKYGVTTEICHKCIDMKRAKVMAERRRIYADRLKRRKHVPEFMKT